MNLAIVAVVVGLIAIAAVAALLTLLNRASSPKHGTSPASGPAMPYKKRRSLFTKNEAAFFHSLRQATGDRYVVLAQVPLNVLLYCDRDARKGGWNNKIDRKRVDFVLCNAQTLAVAGVIELDDKSHQRRDRQQRDAFVDEALRTAGILLLRIPAAAEYPVTHIRAHLSSLLTD